MLIAILIALFCVNPIIAIVAFGGFGVIYFGIIKLSRKRLLLDSQCIARESINVIKSLQEGLGGIRDVLIDGSQSVYCQIYADADQPLRRAQGSSFFISQSPRYGMEALGMLLIAGLAYVLAKQVDGVAKAIPTLGALALGAQRLLPVLQQAYSSWSNMQAGHALLYDAIELLDQPLPSYANQPVLENLPFRECVTIKNLSFRYSADSPWVLKHLNLSIAQGSRVGFIGTTGSGKSTLLDIVMGLLQPVEGSLEVDGHPITLTNCRNWQAHIAHVPQAIFLADSTIEENIAFGVPVYKIDSVRVKNAAKQAQISEVIDSWPQGYKTIVGERGVRLSGGQRQRIGIARALYKQADVIIFDEATSALDNETEQAVMHAIESLSKNLTVLIIAHRLTTLKNCSQIIELSGGNVNRVGSYSELVLGY
jgi:ATP-binding cassette subfamily B protein